MRVIFSLLLLSMFVPLSLVAVRETASPQGEDISVPKASAPLPPAPLPPAPKVSIPPAPLPPAPKVSIPPAPLPPAPLPPAPKVPACSLRDGKAKKTSERRYSNVSEELRESFKGGKDPCAVLVMLNGGLEGETEVWWPKSRQPEPPKTERRVPAPSNTDWGGMLPPFSPHRPLCSSNSTP